MKIKSLTLVGTSRLPIYRLIDKPLPGGYLSRVVADETVPTELALSAQRDGRIQARVMELGTLFNGHRTEDRLHQVKGFSPDVEITHWLDTSDNPWEGIRFNGEPFGWKKEETYLHLYSFNDWASLHVSLWYGYREYETAEPRLGSPVVFRIDLDEKGREAMRQFVESFKDGGSGHAA